MRPAPYFAVITAASFLLACVSGPLLAANPELKEAEAQTPPRRLPTVIRLYEWRVLQAAPGKLDALHSRLRDHQIPILEQHGIFTQGVFVPAGENPEQRVYLLVAAEGLGPMHDGWKEFRADAQALERIFPPAFRGPKAAPPEV